MDKTKNTRKNYGTAYFATAFLAAFFFEFYWIMTDPYNYFMLLGTGFIMIIMGYLTIDSLLKAKADNDAIKNEQNEMMLKAQKAIYIATKKNSKDSAIRQAQSVKAMELMMNKMISSQQALLEEKNGDDMNALIDQLSASNAKLAKEVQSALTVNQLVKANADLVKNVKEALNANAMKPEEAIDLSAYVNEAVNTSSAQPVAPVYTPPVEPNVTESPVESVVEEETLSTDIDIPIEDVEEALTPDIDIPVAEEEVDEEAEEEVLTPSIDIPVAEEEVNEKMEEEVFTTDIDVPVENIEDSSSEFSNLESSDLNMDVEIEDTTDEIDLSMIDSGVDEDMTVDEEAFTDEAIPNDVTIDDELVSDVSINFEPDTMEAIENEINIAEMERSEALEAITIPDEMTPELDEAMTQGNPEEIMEDNEDIDTDEDEDEDDIEPLDIASGEIPNRQLSDEEIAALFASL